VYTDTGPLGKKIDLTGEDIHNVAGLLKLFFRELPEPLLTFELYESFIAAMGTHNALLHYFMANNKIIIAQHDAESQIECIGRAIEVLPAGNKSILKYLVQFLSKVAAVKENSMVRTWQFIHSSSKILTCILDFTKYRYCVRTKSYSTTCGNLSSCHHKLTECE